MRDGVRRDHGERSPCAHRGRSRPVTPLQASLEDPSRAPSSDLTVREQEIVKLVAESYTSGEIGRLLHISRRTVDRHRENVLAKLGMRDRVQLTRYAIRHGLIDP